MSLLSGRKLYVTAEEHDKLAHFARQYDEGHLSEEMFLDCIDALIDVSPSVLLRHRWYVEVVQEVTRRCGRNWQTRGNLRRMMDRNDPKKVADAKRRALNSLRFGGFS